MGSPITPHFWENYDLWDTMSKVNFDQLKLGPLSSKVEFFANSSSDISTYNNFINLVPNGSQADLSVSASSGSGNVLIQAFATQINDPYLSIIPEGCWQFNYYAYADSITVGVSSIVFSVYIRDTFGVETLLFTVSNPINSTSIGFDTVSYILQLSDYLLEHG